MDQVITLTLNKCQQSITVPYSTKIPLEIRSNLNAAQSMTVGVSNFPLFEAAHLAALETIISAQMQVHLVAQALIIDIDPDKIADLDDMLIADLDIGRDELFNSTD